MNFKISHLAVLLLGITLLISTSATSYDNCIFRVLPYHANGPEYMVLERVEGHVYQSPFKGYVKANGKKIPTSYSSIRSIEAGHKDCKLYAMEAYSSRSFSGQSLSHYFGDKDTVLFPFCVKSFILKP